MYGDITKQTMEVSAHQEEGRGGGGYRYYIDNGYITKM